MKARAIRRVSAAAIITLVTVAAGAADTGAQEAPHFSAEDLAPVERLTGTKSPSSRLAETDPSLLGRTDATPVEVLIKLDHDPAATYEGGVADLAATSPAVTGEELSGVSAAEQQYDGYLAGQEAAFVAELAAVVPEASVGARLRTVYGGVAATVPANRIADVLAITDVVAVQSDELRQLLTDSSPEFIGATSLYPDLGGDTQAGAGTVLGVLDSGAWPEHLSLADQGNLEAPPDKGDGTARACDFGDNPLTPEPDVFACNNKLIGGEAFLDAYLANPDRAADEPYTTARDSDGHGTHTGTTAAGNALPEAPVFGVDRGPINGIAPGAWVSVYKVCGILGCFSSDSALAIGQAILDGVDVINFSISGGTSPFTDPVELAFLDAYAAGVFVAASAGNDGPGAATANHLSPWVTTVAASTQTREFTSTLTLTGDDGATATFEGASITAGVEEPTEVVLAPGDPGSVGRQCREPAAAGTYAGKIVACERGTNARVDKGYNVAQGGAVGMILYNPALADIETDNHWLPTVHLADGTEFVAFMGDNEAVTGTFTAGEAVDGQGDVMAAFSSRGPAGSFIKPDVTAPGVQILAGHTPTPDQTAAGPPGEYFQAIAGTSMSSPHVAGAALLLAAYNPEWTPGQIKSALMTTGVTDVVKEDLETPADPFDFGGGRIDLTVAATPGLTFDESAADMTALGNDPANGVNLNLPSVNAPVLPGRVSTVRTAENVSGVRMRYTVETTAPEDTTISVYPSRFALDPNESIELSIVVETTAREAQYFGEIRLVPRRAGFPTLHMPVAFVPQQGDVSLASQCRPSRIPRGGESECTITAQNNSFNDTSADFLTRVEGAVRIDRADGATVTSSSTAELRDAPLSGVVPGTPAIGPGELFGYVPLETFGVTPEPIGDEDIVNFDVPPFEYAGKTYTAVGVDSNGYLVVGGGTAEDNECCEPEIPSPARPNNVLAPFWTDLDGSSDQGIRVGVLEDDTGLAWIVVEWQVDVFGTDSNRHFQVWMGINGEEDITFAYDPAALPAAPEGQELVIGAENEFGTGGDTITGLPTEDLRVESSDPVPGGSVSYTVWVEGRQPGLGVVTTEMVSPDVPGTTIVRSEVNVRSRGRIRVAQAQAA